MLLSFPSSLYFIASSNLASLNAGLWERPTFASLWFETCIFSAALCTLWNWTRPHEVQETVKPDLFFLPPADTHLLTAPDDVIYFVLILQQLSQLSGRQRHDEPARWMLFASSKFGACLSLRLPAGAPRELWWCIHGLPENYATIGYTPIRKL